MKRMLACGLTAALLLAPGPAHALDKAQLIDAVASGAKLTKADAGRFLDAFTGALGARLKKGDRISLVGFGSFSVSKRVASANGCASDVEIDFSPSASFAAKKEEGGRHTPFHNKIARILPQSDGTIQVLGPNDGVLVQKGDPVAINKRNAGSVAGITGGVIAGIVVAGRAGTNEIVDVGSGDAVRGVVLAGVPRTALEIGGSIITLPQPVFDDPIGKCDEGGYDGTIATDEDMLKLLGGALPGGSVISAYNALLDTIVDAVNAGDYVDAGGLGLFVEEELISATVADDPCAGLPENCPPTGSESTSAAYFEIGVSVQSGAVTETERKGLEATLEGIAQRAARTGRNPQTGKEIQVSAAKKVKFKAGAELAGTVNK